MILFIPLLLIQSTYKHTFVVPIEPQMSQTLRAICHQGCLIHDFLPYTSIRIQILWHSNKQGHIFVAPYTAESHKPVQIVSECA